MPSASDAQCTSYSAAPGAALAACRPYVVRYLHSLGASLEDAEDLAQDTLLVALRAIPSFRGDASLSTWVCRIAYRVHAHWCKHSIPWVALPNEDEVPLVEGPEDAILQRMALCEGLRHLPEPLRLLVCSHYLQGCSYREICRGRGMTMSRLTNELSAARRQLRKHLALPSH